MIPMDDGSLKADIQKGEKEHNHQVIPNEEGQLMPGRDQEADHNG